MYGYILKGTVTNAKYIEERIEPGEEDGNP